MTNMLEKLLNIVQRKQKNNQREQKLSRHFLFFACHLLIGRWQWLLHFFLHLELSYLSLGSLNLSIEWYDVARSIFLCQDHVNHYFPPYTWLLWYHIVGSDRDYEYFISTTMQLWDIKPKQILVILAFIKHKYIYTTYTINIKLNY